VIYEIVTFALRIVHLLFQQASRNIIRGSLLRRLDYNCDRLVVLLDELAQLVDQRAWPTAAVWTWLLGNPREVLLHGQTFECPNVSAEAADTVTLQIIETFQNWFRVCRHF